jgi:hypothetical protein
MISKGILILSSLQETSNISELEFAYIMYAHNYETIYSEENK